MNKILLAKQPENHFIPYISILSAFYSLLHLKMTSSVGLFLFEHHGSQDLISSGLIFHEPKPHDESTCSVLHCTKPSTHTKEMRVCPVSPYGIAFIYQVVERMPRIQVRFCNECISSLAVGTKLTIDPSLHDSILAYCTFTSDRDT